MQIIDSFVCLYQPPGASEPGSSGQMPVEMRGTLVETLLIYAGEAMAEFAERDGMPRAITMSEEAAALCTAELGGLPGFIFVKPDSHDLYLVAPSVTPGKMGIFMAAMTEARATMGLRFFTAEVRVN